MVVDRPDELGRMRERRVVGVHDHLREERRDRATAEDVDELLLEQIADHALALGAEHVERVRRDLRICLALECEQPDLRPVAVRDDDLVLGRELGERLDGGRYVVALHRSVGRLTALEQCVPSESNHDPHGSHLPVAADKGIERRLLGRQAVRRLLPHGAVGPSITAVATSSPRWAGRQCRNTASGAAGRHQRRSDPVGLQVVRGAAGARPRRPSTPRRRCRPRGSVTASRGSGERR